MEQLNRDISRMKSQKISFQKSMEQKEKEFREWRIQREREVMQLRRNQQRSNAQLQEHVNMHAKQQVREACLEVVSKQMMFHGPRLIWSLLKVHDHHKKHVVVHILMGAYLVFVKNAYSG